MQTKHTFIFTLLLGLGWAGFLFAYQNGPDPGVNGILGAGTACNQAGCHVGNPLNAAGGTLTLSGLPAQWNPGETYPLTVTIQRTGAVTYGFQLSAISDGTNLQAGTLTKGKPSGTDNTRISILTANLPTTGVQYAQHNQFNSTLVATNTFFVNWTAPASASFGAVRFNLAANAANGNVQNTGDFIYTRVDTVSPASGPAPDFSISAAPPSATVTAGTNAGYTVSVTGANGFAGNVALSVSGLPTGATANFNPASIGAGAGSALTIGTLGVAAGTYSLTITGTSGSLSHSTGVSLTVNAAVTTVEFRDFSMVNMGGMSTSTDGSGGLNVGYSRIQAGAGSTTPAGVAIFGYRTNNVLVTETGVPASPLIMAGRLPAEVTASTVPSINTGLAIANPNGQTANISFFFTDTTGNNVKSGTTSIGANSQLARFLDEAPYSGPKPFSGTFSFTSDVPVSVIALRGLTNERAQPDFLLTTLPVIDTSVAAATGTQFVPYFVTGFGGWTTQVVLVNPGTTALAGNVQFVNNQGAAATVNVNGQSASSAAYSVAARSSQRLLITGGDLQGSVRIVPTGGGAGPTPLVVFTFKPSAFTVSEAAAPANRGTAFRMYVESTAPAEGNIRTGIAVTNTSTGAANVTFELFDLSGAGLASKVINLGASAQLVQFFDDAVLFPNITKPFKGVLRISAPAEISVVGLRGRTNERNDFLITTTPPTLESAPATSAEMLFPHLVNGGGYTTQFILFSGTAGQISSGTLRFYKTDGTPLGLSLQ